VLLCTAQVALGEQDAALESMRGAMAIWPLLTFDPRTTSPRVMEVFRKVRAGSTPAKPAS
jgi:hypothetical protein